MRKALSALLLSAAVLSGCGSVYGGIPMPGGGPLGDVIPVGDDRGERGDVRGARTLGVPKGHYPPPGECRLWYPGTPPGQQPPPETCDQLVGRVPIGAFVLYNDKEWDSRYDWRDHERRNRASVPGVILQLMNR